MKNLSAQIKPFSSPKMRQVIINTIFGALLLMFVGQVGRAAESKAGSDSIGTCDMTTMALPVEVEGTIVGTSPIAYASLNAAFAAINAGTHTGAISVEICGNTTEPAAAVPLLRSNAPSDYTSISIKPIGSVTVNSAAAPTAQRGVIEFNGADNVTIDGDDPLTSGLRNLTFQAAAVATTGVAVIRFASSSSTDGATNNTVRNCNITGSRATAVSIVSNYGIYSGTAGTGATSTSGQSDNNDNLTIENNIIARAYYGIYAAGTTANVMDNLVIRNNFIGTVAASNSIGIRAIYIQNTQNTTSAASALIEGNDIRATASSANAAASVAGIEVANGNAGAEIRRNKIHDINHPKLNAGVGEGAFGIHVTGSGNAAGVTISNNFIYDITNNNSSPTVTATTSTIPVGIRVSVGATGLKIYHNSISLNAANGTPAAPGASACVQLTTTGITGSDIRNNIFSNTQTGAAGSKYYTFIVPNGFPFGTINYNDYNASTAINIIGWDGADRVTLADWQAATTQDANSQAVDPLFVSFTDLHLQGGSPLLGDAVVIGSITNDFDNDARQTAPDIGADELLNGTGGTGTYYNASFGTGDTLGGNVTVTNSLTLTGTVQGGGNTLTLGCNATIMGAGGANYVDGAVAKNICATTLTPVLIPVGDNGYSPVTLTTFTGTGTLTAQAFNSAQPGVQLPARAINRYWSLNNNGLTDATPRFDYLPTDVPGAPADPTLFRIYKDTNGTGTGFTFPDGTSDNVDETNNFGQLLAPTATFSNWGIGQGIAPTAATASVSGHITNQRGFALNGVEIQIRNAQTNELLTTTTDETGDYQFDALLVGQAYLVVPARQGYTFAPASRVINHVEQTEGVDFAANATSARAAHVRNDFDGDGRTDVTVFRSDNGSWYARQSGNGALLALQFGTASDTLVPADYDGDGRTDVAVFRSSENNWYIWQSTTNSLRTENWGTTGDIPTAADFDGDGRADVAVWRESEGTWHIRQSTNGAICTAQFGQAGDKPLLGDYDGDGRTDLAVIRASDTVNDSRVEVYILRSTDNSFAAVQWGIRSDVFVTEDYDGDGRDDLAVYRNNSWYIRKSHDSELLSIQWGATGDTPVGGDLDGDGRADLTVWRPAGGIFFTLRNGNNTMSAEQWGLATDKALTNAVKF